MYKYMNDLNTWFFAHVSGMLHAIHIGEMDVNDKAELVIDTPIQDGLADN